MLRLAVAVGALGLAVVLLAGTGASGQDKETTPGRVKGQLPAGWKKIGLTDEQVQRIYTIQGQYRAQIDKLRAELRKVEREERREMFKVLTEDQKAALKRVLESKAGEPGATETKKPNSKKD
jgi:Spy/CpxP family protein refolding chaperone